MLILLRIFSESFWQAISQFKGNKLRTMLSLLGITIGIFCIIAVKSAFDSLETDIRNSFSKLGDNILFVSKDSWTEDPGQNYWKNMRKPQPNIRDFKALNTRLSSENQVSVAFMLARDKIKHESSEVDNALLFTVSDNYSDVFNLQYEKGRFFSPFEFQNGSLATVLGFEVAKTLFGDADPIGQNVKLLGRRFRVIGVIEKSGESLISLVNYDLIVIIPLSTGARFYNLGESSKYNAVLAVKAAEGRSLDDLTDEVSMIIRSKRKLKPSTEDNFYLNQLTMLGQLLDKIFGVLNIAGFIIGLFAIIVGMFSVANIMYVSVKERTSIIGIKKAVGAKYYAILLEFLIESVILCIIGGLIGLGLVYVIMKILSTGSRFELFMSLENLLIGTILSTVIGILAGILPAIQAARMDPVEAMRK